MKPPGVLPVPIKELNDSKKQSHQDFINDNHPCWLLFFMKILICSLVDRFNVDGLQNGEGKRDECAISCVQYCLFFPGRRKEGSWQSRDIQTFLHSSNYIDFCSDLAFLIWLKAVASYMNFLFALHNCGYLFLNVFLVVFLCLFVVCCFFSGLRQQNWMCISVLYLSRKLPSPQKASQTAA